jgi:signal peptidase I
MKKFSKKTLRIFKFLFKKNKSLKATFFKKLKRLNPFRKKTLLEKFQDRIGDLIYNIPRIKIKNKSIILERNIGGDSIIDAFLRVFYAFCLVILIHSFIFMPFVIQSYSMEPNLLKGDYVLVTKYSYGYNKYSIFFNSLIKKPIFKKSPKRGDVIVFKSPLDTKTNYAKRLVALPNDVIQMKDGIFYVNDKPFNIEFLSDYSYVCNKNKSCEIYKKAKEFFETMPNGKKYRILSAEEGSDGDNTFAYRVPKDHYFVMGDNRDDSFDSRFTDIGFIPHKNLIGKVRFILFSSNSKSINFLKIRKDRKFKKVN